LIMTTSASRTAFNVLIAVSVSHLLNDLLQSLLPALYPLFKAKFDLDFNDPTLTFHLGFAVRRRHQVGAREIQLGSSAAMPIVDRLDRAADHVHAEDGCRTYGLGDHRLLRTYGRLRDDGCLRISLSNCTQTEGDSGS